MFASLIYVFTVSSLTFAAVDAEQMTSLPHDQEANNCFLPPYPEHGKYTISKYPSATPGERYPSVKLDVSCDIGYKNENIIKTIFCLNGDWSASMPTCVRDLLGFCTLSTNDLRVEYRCLSFPGTLERSWECESTVPSGTLVRPICRLPAYFSLKVLSEMHCRDGTWDYNPICKPACGLTTQHRQLEGTSSNHQELPWHAVIYKKSSEPHVQYCGGSLITANKIISAAYCFCDDKDKLLPASNFVVAVNKMYQSFNDPRDKNSQHSDVAEVKIPSSYRGKAMGFVNNIAIAVVKKPFFFHLSVRPVCLDFDNNLDRTQLTKGNFGKTVRWSRAGDNNQLTDVLYVLDLPYVKFGDCNINRWPLEYRRNLANDKFCTTFNNGTWRGKTDAGSGLAFLESTTKRHYLRGVFSVYIAKNGMNRINMYTSIVKHEQFIKQHL